MTTIYFAGKMGSGMGDCDCEARDACHPHCEPEHAHKCASSYTEQNWRYDIVEKIPNMGQKVVMRSGYVFGGPWFVDTDNHDMDADHVAGRCLQWIDQSDAVFAWITTLDAYGTLAEMGYAKALKKPVYAAFDRGNISDADERELWFIRQLADGFCAVRNARTAFAIFTHWLNARNAPVLAYGSRW